MAVLSMLSDYLASHGCHRYLAVAVLLHYAPPQLADIVVGIEQVVVVVSEAQIP